MRRRIISILVAAVLIVLSVERPVGAWDMFVRLLSGEEAVMNWFTEIDYWLLNNDIHPFLLAAGLTVLLSGWIIPDVWPIVRRRVFGRECEAFFADFRRPENQKARQDFLWNLHKAYRRYDANAKTDTLAEKLDRLKFPDDFPPLAGSLRNYAYNPQWPDTQSADLWNFFVVLFSDAGNPNTEDSALLCAIKYEQFLDGRRISSKFWDDWAREIEAGRLDYNEIRSAVFANGRAITALALSEMALACEIPYDRGPGKTALFKLAMGPNCIRPAGWWHRLWRKLRGRKNGAR